MVTKTLNLLALDRVNARIMFSTALIDGYRCLNFCPIAGVNKLAFKWIIIWEKFPQNGLWGRVSSRRRQLAKLFPRENYHPGRMAKFPLREEFPCPNSSRVKHFPSPREFDPLMGMRKLKLFSK